MYAKPWFLLKCCIVGVSFSVTEASVLLQTSDGEKTYVKGSNVELVCTITPYNNAMTWYVGTDVYADCFLGTCTTYLNKPYTFTFNFNETEGVFQLAIDSVNSSHANLTFACDDGIVRETISFHVTSVNDNGGGGGGDSGGGEIPFWVWIIVGIVVAIIIITIVCCCCDCCCCKGKQGKYCNNSCQRDQQEAAAAAAQHQEHLARQRRMDHQRAEAAAAAAQHQTHLAGQRRMEKLTEIIEKWIAKPEYYPIIMQEFLKIDTLFKTLVKETEKVFSKEHGQQPFRGRHTEQGQLFATVRYIEQEWKLRQQRLGQRRISLDLVGSTTDARSKMQELVNDSTFSSHIMQDKDFLRFIKRELQTNTALYEAIEEVIGEE